MNEFPDQLVVPQPNMIDREFWAHCAQQRLMFQACGSCGLLRHPPTPFCPSCQSIHVQWREAPPVGEVYSFTVSHVSQKHGLSGAESCIIAVIEFPGFGPVRLVSNVATLPENMRIGMAVTLYWQSVGDGMSLPLFRPVDDPGGA